MKLRFRTALKEDIPAIRELIGASVRQLQVEYSPAQREAALETVFTVDSMLIADGTYLLALSDEGQLVGCGGWSKRKTLYGGDHQVGSVEPELSDPTRDAAKIRAIFVHPNFARQGIGSALMKESEVEAISYGFDKFEMGSTLSGVALYSLKGYREVETIQVPVGRGESIRVVRMVKDAASSSTVL